MKILPSLKQLEYLTALADTQHFGKAAERCHVTPSTLSAGIRDLEEVLEVSLAERSKRHVLMTPLGLEIAARARLLLRDAQDIMELAASQKPPLGGDLRLGVIPTISPYLLPQALPLLRDQAPGLRLYLREAQTADLLKRLREGELDAVLLALPFEIDGLDCQPLFEDAFLFACQAGHELAAREAISTTDLMGQPLLLLEEGHCLRAHALDACHFGDNPVKSAYEATSLPTLVQMVAAGLGVTLLPQMAVEAGVAMEAKITTVPLVAGAATRQIGLVWRSSSPRDEEFRLLGNMLASGQKSRACD